MRRPLVDLVPGPEDRLEDRRRDLADATRFRRDRRQLATLVGDSVGDLEAGFDGCRADLTVERERLTGEDDDAVQT